MSPGSPAGCGLVGKAPPHPWEAPHQGLVCLKTHTPTAESENFHSNYLRINIIRYFRSSVRKAVIL